MKEYLSAALRKFPCRRFYDPPVPAAVPPIMPIGLNRQRELPLDFQDALVRTKSGLVQGFIMRTIKGRRIYAFTGVPYGEPPTGQLRYNAPVPKRPWSGTLFATRPSPVCLQVDALQLLRIIGSEDCLHLNIYTPQLPTGRELNRLPVIFFIHGGSFFFGSGSSYGPAYLLDREVIFVTINYRLGALGFLTTGDNVASGNWALKDQNLALRWVHENIAFFGGDPTRITLMGQSAGAVSVHLHMLSKQSQGLFKSAISQSASAFCFWAVRNETLRFSYRLAAGLKCPVNDSRLLIECMRRRDPNLSLYHEMKLPQYWIFPGITMGPVIEPAGPDAFLEDSPENLYEKGLVNPVPWMSGFLADEGNSLGIVTYLYPFILDRIDRKWSEISHKVLDFDGDIRMITKATYLVRDFYLQEQPINFYTRHQIGDLFGDRLIVNGVHRGLQWHSRIAPTYGYFFNFTGKYGYASVHGLNVADWGISHNDDLIYLVNSTIHPSLRTTDAEYEISELLVNLWVNFAADREPIYTTDEGEEIELWEPIQDWQNMRFLKIDGDVPEMIPEPFLARIKLWEDLGLLTDSIVGPLNMSSPNIQRVFSSSAQSSTDASTSASTSTSVSTVVMSSKNLTDVGMDMDMESTTVLMDMAIDDDINMDMDMESTTERARITRDQNFSKNIFEIIDSFNLRSAMKKRLKTSNNTGII